MGRFDGKVALITGSSSGIGQAAAILFAKEGAKLTITGTNAQTLSETRSQCINAGAKEDDILEILGDITDENVQNNLISKTIEKFGKLNILVNNHGGGCEERDDKGNLNFNAFDTIMNINFKSKYMLSVKAMPYLKESKGDIVNMSSIGSQAADINFPFYSLASSCVDNVTKLLAFEYAKDGVRVNSINPAIVDTPAYIKFGFTRELAEKLFDHVAKTSVPLGCIPKAKDIAELIVFLADRTVSMHITGQSIPIDGGCLLKVAVVDYDKEECMKLLTS